ncbi:Tetratricopeptide repeat protein [Grimontia celer]|uniref:Tetratricopeptide repeat protein n=1 Tax=Grimontia celer TaxID=1796497 RepID=A0A128F3U2_9GAMM|nr:AMIN domain-containing protein [Grimontia celer]CZF81100.1 Tetratricopeptide repeat protein [Grimontia celer]
MKHIIVAASFLVLTACSSSGIVDEYAGEKGEQLLLQTGNYASLVKRYQEQLKANPSPELRHKLADALYKSGDPEAAQFQLALIPLEAIEDAKLEMLRANVLYDLDRLNAAEKHVNTALRLDNGNSEAYNLKGLLLAQRGELEKAKQAFENARLNGFNDATIKNNLAMVAMLRGDFNQAADILWPLVVNGRADQIVKANLLLSLAKSGRSREFSQLLASEGDREKIGKRYSSLNHVKPFNSFAQTSEKLASRDTTNASANKKAATPARKEKEIEPQKDVAKTLVAIQKQAKPISALPKNSTIIETDEDKKVVITAQNSSITSIASEKPDPLELARQRVKAAMEAKKDKEELVAQQQALKMSQESTKKTSKKNKRTRYLLTDMRYLPADGGSEYIATSDFELGKINSQYLEKRKKWVFDVQGAKDFTTKRKRYLKDGPAKSIELGEHKSFVRIVLEMRENTKEKPEITVQGKTLTIRWDG